MIPLYQAEINRLQTNPPVPSYSIERYNQFQSTLQPILDALAQNGTATFANGETDMSCKVTSNPRATGCMQSSTLTHEGIHAAVCKQYGSSWWAGTWKQKIGLVAVYQNEIDAYRTERDFLQSLLPSLQASCTPWSGVVASKFHIGISQIVPMPAMKPGVQAKSSTLNLRSYAR